jgi:hypothetical protein
MNDAAAETATVMSAGLADTSISAAAETATGITISAVATSLISWRSVTVNTKTASTTIARLAPCASGIAPNSKKPERPTPASPPGRRRRSR